MKRTPTPADYRSYMEAYGLAIEDFQDVELRSYKRGEYLCRQGCPMEELLFLVEGRVKVCAIGVADKTLLFCYNEPGALVGEVELMTQGPASSTLQAAGPVRCLAIPLQKYRDTLLNNIRFMNRIALMMARIVARNSINDSFNILAPLDTRLRAYILLNSSQGLFSGRLTEAAEYLGVSYRHLLRTLNELCQRGDLKKEEKGYRIQVRDAFESALDDGEWSKERDKFSD